MYTFNREALIWGFELLISGNRTHERSRSRDVYSSRNNILSVFLFCFLQKNKEFMVFIFKMNFSLVH